MRNKINIEANNPIAQLHLNINIIMKYANITRPRIASDRSTFFCALAITTLQLIIAVYTDRLFFFLLFFADEAPNSFF